MALADAWAYNGDDTDHVLHEQARAQPLALQLQRRAEAVELQGGKGLLARQA